MYIAQQLHIGCCDAGLKILVGDADKCFSGAVGGDTKRYFDDAGGDESGVGCFLWICGQQRVFRQCE